MAISPRQGGIMYKIEIDISDWEFGTDTVVIETNDFEKIAIIQEFIEFQENHSWSVDYDVVDDYEYQIDEEVIEDEFSEEEVNEDEDESVEDEESEEYEIGEIVEDDDGVIWKRVA